MFDFLFGGKRKLELIRELLEQRMRDVGFDDMESKLKIKELGNIQLIGTPEGAIVTILETVIDLQNKGLIIKNIIISIEDHRKSLGQDITELLKVLKIASWPSRESCEAIPMYCWYRINIESPGRMTEEQFNNAFEQAASFLCGDANFYACHEPLNKLSISPSHHLKWDEEKNKYIIEYPEGVVELNVSSAEILKLCDGCRTVQEIITELEKKFATKGLSNDIKKFIDIALQNGWVKNSLK